MNGLVVLSTFLAAGVEWVEALTIVLAVGLYANWRSAISGTCAALASLAVLVALFGVGITRIVSINDARTVIGVLLLLFGLKWLHKAILRSSGRKSLHDEAAEFEATRASLTAASGRAQRSAFATAFGGVFLEGLEVVFIVIALGGAGHTVGAVTGAACALLVVVVAGVSLRQPLTRVPENALKYTVGVMLTSFGTFFVGEGTGVNWWHGDVMLLVLVAVYALMSLVLVAVLRRPAATGPIGGRLHGVVSAGRTLLGLLVDDGGLALAALAVVAGVALYAHRPDASATLAAVLLVGGVVLATVIGLRAALAARGAARTPERAGDDDGAPGAGGSGVEDEQRASLPAKR